MDYIREELLRQKRILSVLMGGGRQNEAEAPESREDETMSGGPIGVDVRERVRSVQKRGTETARDLYGWSGGIEVPAAGIRETVIGSGEMGQRAGALSAVEEIGVSVRAARYERTVQGGSVGVKDLSRSIQRDARRYDGGFSIY